MFPSNVVTVTIADPCLSRLDDDGAHGEDAARGEQWVLLPAQARQVLPGPETAVLGCLTRGAPIQKAP
jgi:hypothetical protein